MYYRTLQITVFALAVWQISVILFSLMGAVNRRLVSSLSRLRPFWWWLFWFYCAWFTVVTVCGIWGQVRAHWPIAASMAAGSYVAGATPMGGGTIGFPILVLLFDQPASLGRSFSFCIQSIGMSSATVFLISSRAPIAWRMLIAAMATSAVVIPLTLVYLVPLVQDLYIKLIFACLWAAFGVMTLAKVRDLTRAHHPGYASPGMDALMGVLIGVLGGISTGLTGVGIDMVLYCVLVLMYRCEMRAAIGTSVIIMAFGSLVGVVSSSLMGRLTPEVFYNWAAAAPIVAIGAPLGALMMRIIPRGLTLVFVALLCVGQFVWTLVEERPAIGIIAISVGAVIGANLLFMWMYFVGGGIVRRHHPRIAVQTHGHREG